MTHKEFLDKGRPACMGHPPEKPNRSKIEDDDDPRLQTVFSLQTANVRGATLRRGTNFCETTDYAEEFSG
jgi:hypothetical protein